MIKMKKLIYLLGLVLPMIWTGCMKDHKEDFQFREAVVEFEDATTNNNVAGKDYPLLTALRNGSGEKTYRVNLLGGQLGDDQALAFRVVSEESTAVEGMHYSLPEGNITTLPANSSFALLKINVLDFTPTTGTVQLVLELTGNERVKASERYKRIGIRINLQ